MIHEALSFSHLLDFPSECWNEAAALEKRLRKKGVTAPRDDLFVAAAALHHRVALYPCDAHFRMIRDTGAPDLKLVETEGRIA